MAPETWHVLDRSPKVILFFFNLTPKTFKGTLKVWLATKWEEMWEMRFSLILSVSVNYTQSYALDDLKRVWPSCLSLQDAAITSAYSISGWRRFILFCFVLCGVAIKLTVLCMWGTLCSTERKVTLQCCLVFNTCHCESVQKSVFYMKTKNQDIGVHIEMLLFTNFF